MSDFVWVSRARFAVSSRLDRSHGRLACRLRKFRASERSFVQSFPDFGERRQARRRRLRCRFLRCSRDRLARQPQALHAQPNPRIAAAAPPRGAQGAAGWSAQGGSPIVVAQGENAQILANRYGVPVDALVRANGLASASQVRPGTHIVIPVYNAALAASSGARVAANSAPGKPAAPAKVAGARPRTLASQAESLKAGKTSTPATKAAAARKPTAPSGKAGNSAGQDA